MVEPLSPRALRSHHQIRQVAIEFRRALAGGTADIASAAAAFGAVVTPDAVIGLLDEIRRLQLQAVRREREPRPPGDAKPRGSGPLVSPGLGKKLEEAELALRGVVARNLSGEMANMVSRVRKAATSRLVALQQGGRRRIAESTARRSEAAARALAAVSGRTGSLAARSEASFWVRGSGDRATRTLHGVLTLRADGCLGVRRLLDRSGSADEPAYAKVPHHWVPSGKADDWLPTFPDGSPLPYAELKPLLDEYRAAWERHLEALSATSSEARALETALERVAVRKVAPLLVDGMLAARERAWESLRASLSEADQVRFPDARAQHARDAQEVADFERRHGTLLVASPRGRLGLLQPTMHKGIQVVLVRQHDLALGTSVRPDPDKWKPADGEPVPESG